MRPIDRTEISALLDGTLSPERADEVRRALGEDESLQREYEQLAALDVDLKTYARAMMFKPRVSLPESPAVLRFPVPLVVSVLLLLRVIVKAIPPIVGSGLEVFVLVLVIVWLLKSLIRASDQEGQLVVSKIALLPR
jgi:anti-sigma factor RsiW